METYVCATETMSEAQLKAVLPCLSQAATERFLLYYQMLVGRNARVNLTRITAPDEVATKHFADSILPAALIPEGAFCVDVGTGAGFPGIPLKIVRPDIRLVLIDSLGKRVTFLRELCDALGLVEVDCIHARAEDAAREPTLRAAFDVALSRAVAPANVLVELTVPFVKKGGVSLMYKGPNAQAELTQAAGALKELRSEASVISYNAQWGERNVIRAVKTGDTPKVYPRKAGTASKSPLV